jgi:ankyrin repeat protein
LDNVFELRFCLNDEEDNRNEQISNTSKKIEKIYRFFIQLPCICNDNNFNKFYGSESFCFYEIYQNKEKINDCIENLKLLYGSNVEISNYITKKTECHKKFLGEQYIYNPKSQERLKDRKKIQENIKKLEKLKEEYETNVKIVKLLINQQYYEYFVYHIINNPIKIEKVVDILENDPIIEISYKNKNEGLNILGATVKFTKDVSIVKRLTNLGADIPEDMDISDIIENENIIVLKNILNHTDKEKIKEKIEKITNKLLNFQSIRDIDRIELIEILSNRGILEKNLNILNEVIKHSLSYDILIKILERNRIINMIDLTIITEIIKLGKGRDLDLMLKKRMDLINPTEWDENLFNLYLNNTNVDDYDNINILISILENGANTNIKDDNNNPILSLFINYGRIDSTLKLLDYGADPFIYDNNGNNSFHNSIINGELEIIRYMVNKHFCSNKLVNTRNKKNIPPLELSVKSIHPLASTFIILKSEKCDTNIKTSTNVPIIHYIIDTQHIYSPLKTEILKLFIQKGADLTVQDENRSSIVIKALEKKMINLTIAIINKLIKDEIVKVDNFSGDIDNIEELLIDNINFELSGTGKVSDNYFPLISNQLKTNYKNFLEDNKKNIKTIMEISFIFLKILTLK